MSLINKINSPITTTVPFKNYVERKELEYDLLEMIQPKVEVLSFFVVVGENGSGKTTAAQKICHEVGKGVVYINVPESLELFAEAFAKATGYIHRQNNGIPDWIHKLVYGNDPLKGN